jgi:hypothetical protein
VIAQPTEVPPTRSAHPYPELLKTMARRKKPSSEAALIFRVAGGQVGSYCLANATTFLLTNLALFRKKPISSSLLDHRRSLA